MKKKDGVQIEEILKNSPAFLAGLQSLDLILRIEGESVQELDLFDAVQKIRGPK
jgi:carboxyl-terminal processing protease